ncbi:MAG: glutamate-cysteine ligase family protein [bacterium]
MILQEATEYFIDKFKRVESQRGLHGMRRRVGSELKFPMVNLDGSAVDCALPEALWDFLGTKDWSPVFDSCVGKVTGAEKKGEMNEHRASCETGFCKVEFSLAHMANLHNIHESIQELKSVIHEFSEHFRVAFLGFGLQPLTPPGKHLLMKKSRNIFWDRIFGGHTHIPEHQGTDVHLFTVSASNQVHIDVQVEEAVDAINVFNAFAGPQLALTANSNIWKGYIHPRYKCLGEIFWDWWLKGTHKARYGVPEKKFSSLEEYFLSILKFSPVFVKREDKPVGLPYCPSFLDFYSCTDDALQCASGCMRRRRCGLLADQTEVKVTKKIHDLDQHFTFFWHNARLSRYYTLENRINDQQPPEEMMTIPALTLGIMENLEDAVRLMNEYPWEVWRKLRIQAACDGLDAQLEKIRVHDLSTHIVKIAEKGLRKRALGEEIFLAPLYTRLENRQCPADIAAYVFSTQGYEMFVERYKIKKEEKGS